MKNKDSFPVKVLPSATLVIFGATGDLVWRKLAPALYNLQLAHQLPDHLSILGVGRKPKTSQDFRARVLDGVQQFGDGKDLEQEDWRRFESKLTYLAGDFSDPNTYHAIRSHHQANEDTWGAPAVLAFYLATPPGIVEMIVEGIGGTGMAEDRERVRIVIEKPFGHDLASAVALDHILTAVFEESQIYRIDHYLGKETVQNILAFRFANALFEPIWDRRYIDQVQITVAEQVGVGHRGSYYEQAGAVRDMIQNHLMQILTLIAMEPMVSFDADEIRNKKVDVLGAIRPVSIAQVPDMAIRGQYDQGLIAGKKVPAYREEAGVRPDSRTETFAALKLHVDNWRWQDVPFYLRTGKRLKARASEVFIQFRPVPHQSFPREAVLNWQPNSLTLQIQPQEGILLRFQSKYPGSALSLSPVDMHFSYHEAFESKSPLAYETLLADVIIGDATLFMRADQVEASWSILAPILEAWEEPSEEDFPNYQPGSWGPEAANKLIWKDGREWQIPSMLKSNPSP